MNISETKKKKIAALKVEQRLLEIEKSIRSTLGYEAADTDHCMQLLDELAGMIYHLDNFEMVSKSCYMVDHFRRFTYYQSDAFEEFSSCDAD